MSALRSTIVVSTPHVAIRRCTFWMSSSSGWPRSALNASTVQPASISRFDTVFESRPPDTHTPTLRPDFLR